MEMLNTREEMCFPFVSSLIPSIQHVVTEIRRDEN